MIVKLSFFQNPKDLPHLADDYILETNGSVRVVVGIDIDYYTKKGTISFWCPKYVTNEQGELRLEASEIFHAEVYALSVS